MTNNWFIGDIHGCAEELEELIAKLCLGSEDQLVVLGDLFHRGPDPQGVARLLADVSGFSLVFGNHELVLLRRAGMMPSSPWGPPTALPPNASGFDSDDLSGDGGTPMFNVDPQTSADMLRLLDKGRFFMRGTCARGPFQDRQWLAVHAGVIPGKQAQECSVDDLCRVRQVGRFRSSPFWYEGYRGNEMVIFGHTESEFPRRQMFGGRLVAHGLDTGCVYGGCLTAWCIETDQYEVVPAKQSWYSA